MTKVFLSPSTQEKNQYKGGGNEEKEMRRICAVAKKHLVAAGFEVRIGGTVSAATNVAEGNKWGADIYVAVHSNAGGGKGTEGFYYSKSVKGKKLAEAVYKEVAALTPTKDRGVRPYDTLVEIKGPKAPSTLIEVEFHDSLVLAKWIKNNSGKIGKAIAKGISNYSRR